MSDRRNFWQTLEFLDNNLTSKASKKFSTHLKTMFWVFKRFSKRSSLRQEKNHGHRTYRSRDIEGNVKKNVKKNSLGSTIVKMAKVTWHENKLFFQKILKLSEIVQNRQENVRYNAYTLYFPKPIELLSYDKYFLKKMKKCELVPLILVHHGRIWRMNFKARTLKKNIFIFGFGRGAQVGKASFLEVNVRRKRQGCVYHFYLVRFKP